MHNVIILQILNIEKLSTFGVKCTKPDECVQNKLINQTKRVKQWMIRSGPVKYIYV